MKQFIKILTLMAFIMPQKSNVYAHTSKAQVCMTYVYGDIYSGTVGPRRSPMYRVCPLYVYVDNKNRCLVLQSTVSNCIIAYEIIQGDEEMLVYGDITVNNNDETSIPLNDINDGKYQFKVQIGENSFIGCFELYTE